MQRPGRGPRKGPRRKFHPNPGEKWICAKCGGEIDTLPFIPREGIPVYHYECLPPRE